MQLVQRALAANHEHGQHVKRAEREAAGFAYVAGPCHRRRHYWLHCQSSCYRDLMRMPYALSTAVSSCVELCLEIAALISLCHYLRRTPPPSRSSLSNWQQHMLPGVVTDTAPSLHHDKAPTTTYRRLNPLGYVTVAVAGSGADYDTLWLGVVVHRTTACI